MNRFNDFFARKDTPPVTNGPASPAAIAAFTAELARLFDASKRPAVEADVQGQMTWLGDRGYMQSLALIERAAAADGAATFHSVTAGLGGARIGLFGDLFDPASLRGEIHYDAVSLGNGLINSPEGAQQRRADDLVGPTQIEAGEPWAISDERLAAWTGILRSVSLLTAIEPTAAPSAYRPAAAAPVEPSVTQQQVQDMLKAVDAVTIPSLTALGMNPTMDTKMTDPSHVPTTEAPEIQSAGPAPSAAAPKPERIPSTTGRLTDEQSAALDAAKAELDDLVGMDNIKDQIQRQIAFTKLGLLREKAGLKTTEMTHHMLFMGNPGTGKTTVARIMGRMYKALGILESGHVIESSRGQLVAQFQGQTAPKTTAEVEKAIGGILFVDEAYALTPDTPGGDSYGEEALSTLLAHMENRRHEFIVIMAGYTDDMHHMIQANSGLPSRFPNHVEFKDFTAPELTEIFRRMAKSEGYKVDDAVAKEVHEIADVMIAHADKSFGNARDIRNLFDRVMEAHALRVTELDEAKDGIVDVDTLERLTCADLEVGKARLPKKAETARDKVPTMEDLVEALHEQSEAETKARLSTEPRELDLPASDVKPELAPKTASSVAPSPQAKAETGHGL